MMMPRIAKWMLRDVNMRKKGGKWCLPPFSPFILLILLLCFRVCFRFCVCRGFFVRDRLVALVSGRCCGLGGLDQLFGCVGVRTGRLEFEKLLKDRNRLRDGVLLSEI